MPYVIQGGRIHSFEDKYPVSSGIPSTTNHMHQRPDPRLTPKLMLSIAQTVLAECSPITMESVIGRSRQHHISEVRRVICWVLYEAGASQPQIAEMLRRDHTSILFHIHKCDDLQKFDQSYRKWVHEILDKVRETTDPLGKFFVPRGTR